MVTVSRAQILTRASFPLYTRGDISSCSMSESYQSGGDFNITSDEANLLKNAFRDKKFLELFEEYVKDINDPENRKKYEEEIISIEKDRGHDVKFVHPEPWYVMKVVCDDKKYFINLCTNEFVVEPTSDSAENGSYWKIPVLMSNPRQDLDAMRLNCTVYDVMFHPTTMVKAQTDPRFKKLAEDVAFETIENKFQVRFGDRKVKYPKMKYKGKPPSVVLRKGKGNVSCEPLEDYCRELFKTEKRSIKKIPPQTKDSSKIPKYSVKYRDVVDLKDFSMLGYTDKVAPKEIVIEVELPKIESISELELDVYEKKVKLKSTGTHFYKLEVDLAYAVNAKAGSAKFDKSTRKLVVKVPVEERIIPLI